MPIRRIPATEIKDISDALGQKVNADKITALITANATTKLSDDQIKEGIYNAVAAYDYDSVIFSLVKKYCPAGLLGLALTALLASFMSGMAGNVTAFNTVWTYNLYQAFFVPNKSDAHYFWMGKFITVVGIGLSIICAYFAKQYNNAMDIIQLVFGFVNAPVFATFLLGMFWKRTTEHRRILRFVRRHRRLDPVPRIDDRDWQFAGCERSHLRADTSA